VRVCVCVPVEEAGRAIRLDAKRFRRHAGNADVVRQELASEKGLVVSLRTVERATAPLRRDLVAAARATLRFETHPGEQLQIDFGERRVEIGGVAVKVFFFVAPFLKSPTSSFFLVPTEMTGSPAAWNACGGSGFSDSGIS
jgi:hypothetical protein